MSIQENIRSVIPGSEVDLPFIGTSTVSYEPSSETQLLHTDNTSLDIDPGTVFFGLSK